MNRRNFLQLLAAAAAFRPQAAASEISLRQALESYKDWPMIGPTVSYPILRLQAITPVLEAAQDTIKHQYEQESAIFAALSQD